MSACPAIQLLNKAYCAPILNHFFEQSIQKKKGFLKEKRDSRQIDHNVRHWAEMHAVLERFNQGEELTQAEHRIICAGVFQTQIPMQKQDKKTEEWLSTKITHNDNFGYLIVQEQGYVARFKPSGVNGLAHPKDNLLPHIFGKYHKKNKKPKPSHPLFGLIDPESIDSSVLVQFLKSWQEGDRQPFIVFDLRARPIDYDAMAISYDARHVVVNSVTNRAIDMSHYLKQEEVQNDTTAN